MTYEDALAILRDGWPITPEDLTQIAARIWDEGYEARQDEEASARVEYGTTFTDIIPNPYRASEGQ